MFEPSLVHEFLTASAKRNPYKIAIVCDDERLTYKEFDEKTDSLAQSLIELGLERHERVIIFLDNSIEMAIAMYSVLKAGGVFVNLSSSVKSERLKYTVNDSNAKFIIASVTNMETITNALSCEGNTCRPVWIGDPSFISSILLPSSLLWNDLLTKFSPDLRLQNRKSQIIDYDLATLVYTSGSTGEPKGVMSPHSNMIHVSKNVIRYLENTQNDIILNVLPLSFVYGLYQLIVSVITGGTLVLEKSLMFPNKIIHTIQKENVTGMPIIPTVAALLLKLHGLEKVDLSSLRYITNAGSGLPVEHIVRLRSLFPHVKIYSMYGCAECLRVAYLPPEEIDLRPASVGKAIPNCEVFIVDENDNLVKQGEIGELVVRGTHVMRGYWNAPLLTEKIFGKGFMQGEVLLHTGDFFRQDENEYLYFVCRKDDMIKTAGKKVSPKEIENVLYCINGVVEVSVVGIPDNILGMAVKAFVVVAPEIEISKSDIIRYCSEHLERHLIPKYIEFVDSLPKTINGKIDKASLRKQAVTA